MITIKSLLWKVKKDRFQFTEQGLFKMKKAPEGAFNN